MNRGIVGPLSMLCMMVLIIFCSIYGLYLAFTASIILGIGVLIIEPLPLVFGLLGLISHSNVCEKVAYALKLPW